MANTLGVVMASSKSKRCPNKNIAVICDKPVLAYAIDILKASKACDNVIVSTDSQAYADLAYKYDADYVVMRETWWDNFPYFTVSVNESRKSYEVSSKQKFHRLVFAGANVIFLRPSWIRAALDILEHYNFNGMPIDLVTNDIDTVPLGVCRIVRDGIVDPNTFKLVHSGLLCDFDWPEELALATEVMTCIQRGALKYSLNESVHDNLLKKMQSSPNHFKNLTPKMCQPA